LEKLPEDVEVEVEETPVFERVEVKEEDSVEEPEIVEKEEVKKKEVRKSIYERFTSGLKDFLNEAE